MNKNEKIDKYYKDIKYSHDNLKQLSSFLLKLDGCVIDEALSIVAKKVKKMEKCVSKKDLEMHINLEKLYSKYDKGDK